MNWLRPPLQGSFVFGGGASSLSDIAAAIMKSAKICAVASAFHLKI